MTPVSPSQAKFWIAGAGAAVVILLLGFSVRSLVVLFGRPQPAGAVNPEPAMVEMQPSSVANQQKGTIHHEHAAVPLAVPSPTAQAPKKTSKFSVDYKTLNEREAGRKEMIKNLREIARDNPESGYAMTDEHLRKFEKSGGSFQ